MMVKNLVTSFVDNVENLIVIRWFTLTEYFEANLSKYIRLVGTSAGEQIAAYLTIFK